jgi:hypothetical protein
MGAVTIALFVQRIRSLGVCNHPKFSLSPSGLKARGQVILAGIILPPKDRAPKGTASLGIATRPAKVSSLDFNKSILITLVERVQVTACPAVTRCPYVHRALIGALLAVLACAVLLWFSCRYLRGFGKLVSEQALNALRQSDAC